MYILFLLHPPRENHICIMHRFIGYQEPYLWKKQFVRYAVTPRSHRTTLLTTHACCDHMPPPSFSSDMGDSLSQPRVSDSVHPSNVQNYFAEKSTLSHAHESSPFVSSSNETFSQNTENCPSMSPGPMITLNTGTTAGGLAIVTPQLRGVREETLSNMVFKTNSSSVSSSNVVEKKTRSSRSIHGLPTPPLCILQNYRLTPWEPQPNHQKSYACWIYFPAPAQWDDNLLSEGTKFFLWTQLPNSNQFFVWISPSGIFVRNFPEDFFMQLPQDPPAQNIRQHSLPAFEKWKKQICLWKKRWKLSNTSTPKYGG